MGAHPPWFSKTYNFQAPTGDTAKAVSSINYIDRQIDVSYFGREMYGEISIYQIRI